MKWKWKRPAAFLLAAAMIFTMPGVPASAVEAGVSAVHTGLCEQCNSQDSGLVSAVSGNAPAECICETHCEQEAVDPDCPVCAAEDADLSACKGTEETVCICTDRCSEEMVNLDCPICSAENADFSACLGKEAAVLAAFALPQAEHTHCVCGKDSGTTVNGHTHNNSTAWTAADSLPGTAGSYYLTQSVSSDWTVPTGEVNLCLNGQTISGKITVGSGATLTLTDCTGTGKLQGSRSGSGVSINGGTFNLYGGTITGFVNGVEIGSHNDIKTGSSFTMYGGAITGNKADSSGGGGVFLIGTTNSVVTAPSFTMHGGTISNNTAGASDGGGGGVYVGVKCSFTMCR